MFGIDLNFRHYKWAFVYCSVSALGALVFGYDNTYYSGILGMQEFKNDYGTRVVDGKKALATDFTSLTTSSIYIGDMLGALSSGVLNDRFGRKAVLLIAAFFVPGRWYCPGSRYSLRGCYLGWSHFDWYWSRQFHSDFASLVSSAAEKRKRKTTTDFM